MLIDGEKWACEACVRGHRVTTCKHHDRPLIHINRKGRPFATCSVCNCTPCEAPEDHAKLKREADARCQASKVEPFPDVQHQHCKPPRPKHILQRQPKKSHSPSESEFSHTLLLHCSREQSKADVDFPLASCSLFQRAAGRSPRSTPVGSLKPIAPRPAPSSTGGGSSGGAGAGFRRDSHSPPTGDYGDHRPRSTISVSPPPPPPPPSSQLYHQQQGLLPGTPGSSPIYLPGTSTSTAYPSPSYCTISDIPSSLSMVNPLDFENGVGVGVGVSSFADSASAAAIYALEDLDVNALPADVFQGDWSWLSISEEAALRDEV